MRNLRAAWTNVKLAVRQVRADRAQFSLAGILAIAVAVITAVVTIQLLGDLAPTYFDSLADFVGVYTSNTTTTNSTTADDLLPTLGLVAAIVGPFALLGLAISAMQIR